LRVVVSLDLPDNILTESVDEPETGNIAGVITECLHIDDHELAILRNTQGWSAACDHCHR
jgi:hypothetical protein